ncbi:MAG TPA: AsmA-like C-terminal region-containing protein, partial [Nitrospirales bacterium]|nr:AsmA-like C-terminal region-containing protein [Nitrospirales bacterium]
MWNLRRKIAWLVLVPLALIAALIVSLPLLLNSADYKDLLIAQAKAQLGRDVEMSAARVEVFPHVRIALDDVVIREADGTTPFLSAEHFFIDLRIFPLLQQMVLAKRIVLDRPRLTITRGVTGLLNISDLFPQAAPDVSVIMPMLGDEISIADGELVFVDFFGTQAGRTVTLRRVNTSLKRSGLQLAFQFFATLSHEAGDATFTLTGQVARYAMEGVARAGKVTGKVEAKKVDLKQFAPFLNDSAFLRALRTPVDLASTFEYSWAPGTRALALQALTVTGAGTTVQGNILLDKLFTPQMQLTSSLTTLPFRLEALLANVPDEALRSLSLGFFKDGQVTGIVQVASLQVEWTPEQERQLTVKGEVNLLEGHAVVGPHRVPISQVKGKLRITPDSVTIEQLTGRYGLADVTEGKGEVTSLAENPALYLDLKGKVSAPELAVIVARFAPKALLPAGTAGLTKLQGGADAVVRLRGPLAKLNDLEVDWGLDAQDVGFTDRRLALPFSGIHGRVRSIPRGVTFERLGGQIGKSFFVLDGGIAIQSDEKAHYALTASGHADVKEVLGVVLTQPSKNFAGVGTAGFGLNISGRTGELSWIGRVDLRQTVLTHTIGFKKPGGLPSSVEFDLLLDAGHRLNVNRFMAEVSPLQVQMKGTLMFQPVGRFNLQVQVPTVDLRTLPKGIIDIKTPPDSGSFQTQFIAIGLLDNWEAAKLKGRAEIKQLGLTLEGIAAPVEDLNMVLSFEGERIVLEQGTLKIKESRINANGSIQGWRGVPRIQAAFDSPGLDLALLIPEGARSPVRVAMEAISSSAILEATAAVRNGLYHGVLFDEIRARISGGGSVLVLDPVTVRMGKGIIVGQVRVALPQGKPAAVESSLHIKGVAVEPVFQSLGIKKPPFTGTLKLEGAISGNGNDPRGIAPSLQGDINVIVEKGYSHELSAAAKIVRLLNLPRLLAGQGVVSEQGMPFDCMSGRVLIKSGMAAIQDSRLDSPIMKMTAVGTYDIPHDNYDMVTVVTPYGSHETLLQSIPLFGKLFAGEREGFSTAFFEVKGPFADPHVTWLPMKSVGSGITGMAKLAFDIMKNVILFPKELFSPSEKPQSPCSAP